MDTKDQLETLKAPSSLLTGCLDWGKSKCCDLKELDCGYQLVVLTGL